VDQTQQYFAPASLNQALERLTGGEVSILAGGTDLMPQAQAGKLRLKRTLMNIRRVPELIGVARQGGDICIGALTTITELMDNALVQQHLPVLVDACNHFASDQIRNAATLGGNICNASPAGDTLIPLLVLDARVELASKRRGKLHWRSLPLAEFFTGPGRTRRAPDELLVGVRIPLPDKGRVAYFHKFGTRPALDISTISIGIAGTLKHGTLSNVRVAFGAVAPTPVRAPLTERALEGKRLDADSIAQVAEVARNEVKPIDDVRATAWYRKEMIHNITRRMLSHVA